MNTVTFQIPPKTLIERELGNCQDYLTKYERDLIAGATPLQGFPQEADPNGKDPHSAGAKLDAGKAEYDMVLYSFPDALAHVDRIGKLGARKYTKGGFLDVPNGQQRYLNAGLRHLKEQLRGELYDPESKELHLAHRAWNALAELQLFLEGKGA